MPLNDSFLSDELKKKLFSEYTNKVKNFGLNAVSNAPKSVGLSAGGTIGGMAGQKLGEKIGLGDEGSAALGIAGNIGGRMLADKAITAGAAKLGGTALGSSLGGTALGSALGLGGGAATGAGTGALAGSIASAAPMAAGTGSLAAGTAGAGLSAGAGLGAAGSLGALGATGIGAPIALGVGALMYGINKAKEDRQNANMAFDMANKATEQNSALNNQNLNRIHQLNPNVASVDNKGQITANAPQKVDPIANYQQMVNNALQPNQPIQPLQTSQEPLSMPDSNLGINTPDVSKTLAPVDSNMLTNEISNQVLGGATNNIGNSISDVADATINAQPVSQPSSSNFIDKIASAVNSGVNDFKNGYIENNTNPMGAVSEQGRKESFLQKLGEGFGTAGKIMQNPYVQGAIAGGLYKASGGNTGDALQYGFNQAMNRANTMNYANALRNAGINVNPGVLGTLGSSDIGAYAKAAITPAEIQYRKSIGNRYAADADRLEAENNMTLGDLAETLKFTYPSFAGRITETEGYDPNMVVGPQLKSIYANSGIVPSITKNKEVNMKNEKWDYTKEGKPTNISETRVTYPDGKPNKSSNWKPGYEQVYNGKGGATQILDKSTGKIYNVDSNGNLVEPNIQPQQKQQPQVQKPKPIVIKATNNKTNDKRRRSF